MPQFPSHPLHLLLPIQIRIRLRMSRLIITPGQRTLPILSSGAEIARVYLVVAITGNLAILCYARILLACQSYSSSP
jgi:hypothetical protein